MKNPNNFTGEIVSLDNLFDDSDTGVIKNDDDTTLDTLGDITDVPIVVTYDVKPDDNNEPDDISDSAIKPDTQGGKDLTFKKTLDYLIDSKVLDSIEKFVVDDDGTEVPYEEAEITPEILSQLINDKIEETKQAVLEEQEKHVSDFTKHLIKIEKSGGDVAKALETYGRLINPLQYLNLDDENDQAKVIELDLKSKGIGDSVIKATIKGFKADGVLKDESEKSFEFLQSQAEKELEEQQKAAVEARNKDKQFIDSYRKTLKSKFEELLIPDSSMKAFIDAATKRLDNSSYAVDAKYSELRRDPEQAAELIMFLMDKKAYLEHKMKEVKMEEKLNVAREVRIIKRNTSTPIPRKKDNNSDDLVSLNELF